MIIYLYGPDTFRSRRYLHEQVAKFKKARDPGGYNVDVLDAKKESPEKIMGAILAMPFLAERRLVVLENLLASNKKEFLADFAGRLKAGRLPDNTVIIVWQTEAIAKIKEAGELDKLLKKEQYAQEFEQLAGSQLLTWIKQELARLGTSAEPAALDLLVKELFGDVWALQGVLEQLASYAGQRAITTADVSLFIEKKFADAIFSLIDELVAGRPKEALRRLLEQRRFGSEDGYIFLMALRQFRVILAMRDALDRDQRITSDELAKQLKIHPFVAKKSLPIARKFPLPTLSARYRELLEIDRQTKTGPGELPVLLERFIVRP